MRYPMKLKAPLKDYLWGGTRLKTAYGKKTELESVAESWELSCHAAGMSVIENGEAAGKTLTQWLAEEGREPLGIKVDAKAQGAFPLLVKLIDAKKDLSIQVHPTDAYARRVEGDFGKTEMWYIVEAEPGASIFYGVKEAMTKEDFARHIRENTLTDILRRIEVHKGETYFIPAGTIHAIEKGTLICEIQQSSNVTYRVYDYDRRGKDGKPRELHIKKAMDVANLEPVKNSAVLNLSVDIFAGAKARLIVAEPCFTVYELQIEDSARLFVREDSFQTFTLLEGALTLLAGDEILPLGKGDTVFLPAGLGRYDLTGFGKVILSKL